MINHIVNATHVPPCENIKSANFSVGCNKPSNRQDLNFIIPELDEPSQKNVYEKKRCTLKDLVSILKYIRDNGIYSVTAYSPDDLKQHGY